MNLIEAFQIQIIFAIIVAIHHLVMCYLYPEREMNLFKDDKSGLIIMMVVWFVVITVVRYWFQIPMLGWIGYIT